MMRNGFAGEGSGTEHIRTEDLLAIANSRRMVPKDGAVSLSIGVPLDRAHSGTEHIRTEDLLATANSRRMVLCPSRSGWHRFIRRLRRFPQRNGPGTIHDPVDCNEVSLHGNEIVVPIVSIGIFCFGSRIRRYRLSQSVLQIRERLQNLHRSRVTFGCCL